MAMAERGVLTIRYLAPTDVTVDWKRREAIYHGHGERLLDALEAAVEEEGDRCEE